MLSSKVSSARATSCARPSCGSRIQLLPKRPLLGRNRVVQEEIEAEVEDEMACSILDVRFCNDESPKYTKMTIEVMQYPSLIRTVAWTMNGLGVRAQNATMKVDEEGFASQTYWLCDLNGEKLSERTAANVKESLHHFVRTCMPPTKQEQKEWTYEDVFVSNKTNDKYTELIIKGEPQKPGFLLEIATVMSAIGTTVHEAVIQGDEDFVSPNSSCSAVESHDFANKGRLFKFLLSEGGVRKLSPGRVASVLYTLDLVAGKGYQPTDLSQSPH